MTPVTSAGLAGWLPQIDWQALASAGQRSAGFRVLAASGLIFSIGLLLRYLGMLGRLRRGESVDWLQPLFCLVGYMVLLRHYNSIVQGLIAFTTQLGWQPGQSEPLLDLTAMRWQAYDNWRAEHPEVTSWSVFTTHMQLWISLTLFELLQLLVSTALLSLKSLQAFFLAIFVQMGPLLLSFSFLGALFAPFATSWLMAIIEVSSWSWCLSVLTQIYANSLQASGQTDFSIAREIVTTATLVIMLCAIPLVSAMLLRGQAAAGVSHLLSATTQMASLAALHLAARPPPASASQPQAAAVPAASSAAIPPLHRPSAMLLRPVDGAGSRAPLTAAPSGKAFATGHPRPPGAPHV